MNFQSERDLVREIKITKSEAHRGKIVAGEWVDETRTIHIVDHDRFTEDQITANFYHEVGHAKYQKMRFDDLKNNTDKIKQWEDGVGSLTPPTYYAESNRQNWKVAEADAKYNRHLYTNPEQLDTNSRLLRSLYYNEVHSEVHSFIKSPKFPDGRMYSEKSMRQLIKLYGEIHG